MSEAGVDSALNKVLAMAGPLLPFWETVVPWMQPLIDGLDQVVGDPAEVRSVAAGWRSLGVEVNQITIGQWELAEPLEQGWSGAAADSYRDLELVLGAAVQNLAADLGQTADYLEAAADAVAAGEQMVLDIIREFIEYLIVTVLTGLLLAAISAGAGAAAAGLAALAESGIAIGRIAEVLATVARLLAGLATTLHRLRTAKDLTIAEKSRRLAVNVAGKRVVRHSTGLTGRPWAPLEGVGPPVPVAP